VDPVTYWQTLKHNAVQLFLAVDQLANVLCTLFTSPAWADETLSSRAWRAERKGRLMGRIWRPLIDLLFLWQRIDPPASGHCHQAYIRERDRVGLPPEMRDPLQTHQTNERTEP
jgi:hypothetical protein